MKKLTILLISLFFVNTLCAQEQKAIRITKQDTQREVVIKENKRIIIKTVDDKKLSGRYRIDGNSIVVDNEKIEINEIRYLKRNPLLTTMLTTGILVYGGFVTATMGVMLGILVDPNAFYLAIPAAGLIYAGLQSPNFHKKYKPAKNWSLEIVTISE
ncbi:hypothetical protein [Marivirga sp.]|uniref:hypothetical protein n=1 Tax=Marivirga sp. TaxID=2018662 RepID=UPI002D7F84E0|nr:hypothetical protein [Marivirga sp.]HET8859669.1 hypothetical protein [Marivirga sp.]